MKERNIPYIAPYPYARRLTDEEHGELQLEAHLLTRSEEPSSPPPTPMPTVAPIEASRLAEILRSHLVSSKGHEHPDSKMALIRETGVSLTAVNTLLGGTNKRKTQMRVLIPLWKACEERGWTTIDRVPTPGFVQKVVTPEEVPAPSVVENRTPGKHHISATLTTRELLAVGHAILGSSMTEPEKEQLLKVLFPA